jgi:sugar phosphate isomerase/epimerase
VRLGCASLSCDGFEDNDFVDTFRLLPTLGYTHVEFDLWHPGNLMRSKIVDLRSRAAAEGLVPAAVYGNHFGHGDKADVVKDITHKLRLIEAALELGCTRIVATGTRGRPPGGLDHVIRVLEHVAPEAEAQGVHICLENHFDNTIETLEDYEAIFDAVSSPAVGMCVDTGHFHASGIDLLGIADRFSERINHVHLKDCRGVGSEEFVALGAGEVDNHGFVERALGRGYRGFLIVELAARDKTHVERDLRSAREAMACHER